MYNWEIYTRTRATCIRHDVQDNWVIDLGNLLSVTSSNEYTIYLHCKRMKEREWGWLADGLDTAVEFHECTKSRFEMNFIWISSPSSLCSVHRERKSRISVVNCRIWSNFHFVYVCSCVEWESEGGGSEREKERQYTGWNWEKKRSTVSENERKLIDSVTRLCTFFIRQHTYSYTPIASRTICYLCVCVCVFSLITEDEPDG